MASNNVKDGGEDICLKHLTFRSLGVNGEIGNVIVGIFTPYETSRQV